MATSRCLMQCGAGFGKVEIEHRVLQAGGGFATSKNTNCAISTRQKQNCALEVEKCFHAGPQQHNAFIVSAILRESIPVKTTLEVDEYPKQSNDFIGFGSLMEGNKIFRERFVVRFSEVGAKGIAPLEEVACLLQEAASNHVTAMSNFRFGPGSKENITVATRMHIEVDRYPAWRDLVEVNTWFQAEGKNSVRRDWIMRDVHRDEVIVRATSFWVVMSTHTRRLKRFSTEEWLEISPWLMNPPKFALASHNNHPSATRIAKLENDAPMKALGLIVLDKDMDMNQHVNNLRYLTWILEGVSEQVRNSFEVSEITLEYRREANKGECLDSLASPEFVDSRKLQYLHLLQTSAEGKEINRGRTVWRPLS